MKSLNTTLAVVSCMLLTFAATAWAAEATVIKANVPFEFQIEDQYFPSGEYVFTYPIAPYRAVILLSTPDGRALRMIQTHGFQPRTLDSNSYLVFNGYGDRYFLSRIWSGALGAGRELPRSSSEKQLRELLDRTAQGTSGMKVIQLSASR